MLQNKKTTTVLYSLSLSLSSKINDGIFTVRKYNDFKVHAIPHRIFKNFT